MDFGFFDYPCLDSEGCLKLKGDPGPWIKDNPDSHLKVLSLKLLYWEKRDGEKISDSISELTELTRLELRCCDYLKGLPYTITCLPNLKVLMIYGCDFEELPDFLGQLKSLTHLSLSYCRSIKELPSSLGRCDSLTHFQIEKCHNIKSLPNSMKNLGSLKSFTISSCRSLTESPFSLNVLHLKLYKCGIKLLPKGLINLQRLEVDNFIFSEESIANLKDSLSLRHLSILNRKVPDVKLPADLNKLVNLQILSIDGVTSIEFSGNLDGLAKLLLIDVRATGIRCLPWSIAKLPSLQILLLPEDFRLQTLPDHLNDNLIISVDAMHVRKIWKEFKIEMGPFLGVEYTIEGVDCYQSTISSPSNYLRSKKWPLIRNNSHSCMMVQILDLEDTDEDAIDDYICELPHLTHLYIIAGGRLNTLLNYVPNTMMNLRHFSAEDFDNDSLCNSLNRLYNLRTLDLTIDCWPDNVDLPASLISLRLNCGDCDNYTICSQRCKTLCDSLAKLSNLKTLNLYYWHSFHILTANLNLTNLKLVNCKNIIPLPTGLRHLEILHVKRYPCQHSPSDDDLEECLKQLVNLETLSFTCPFIKSIPSIAELPNLQELHLKDCFNLKVLPPNLDVLAELCTLNISGTRITSLPDNIMKLHKLKRVILPKCFRQECLLRNLENVYMIDDTDETYYECSCKDYYDFCQETSIETCNDGNDLASGTIVRVDDAGLEGSNQGVIAEQTSTFNLHDASNTLDMGYYEHTSITQVTHESLFHGRKDPIGENNQHASRSSHNQELKVLPSATEQTSSHVLHATQILGGICSNGGEDSCPIGEDNHLALINGQILNPQSGNVKDKTQKKVITLEMLKPFWEKNMKLEDAATQLHVSRSTLKRKLIELNTKWPSSKKGKQHLDAKKRKQTIEAPSLSTSSEQNLVNSTDQQPNLVNSTNSLKNLVISSCPSGSDNVEYTVGADQLMSSNIPPNATMETVTETQMGTQCLMDDHQHAHEHLGGANECTLPNNAQQNESSSTFIVKAAFKDDIARFEFALTHGIDLLKEELGSRLELEVGTFKIKYQDEDKDWVLITRISDLQHALRLSKSSGSNVVRLLILTKT